MPTLVTAGTTTDDRRKDIGALRRQNTSKLSFPLTNEGIDAARNVILESLGLSPMYRYSKGVNQVVKEELEPAGFRIYSTWCFK